MNEFERHDQRVLEFVNRLEDPAEIIKRFETRRNTLPADVQGIDIELPLAQQIVAAREAQPGAAFASIDELVSVGELNAEVLKVFRYLFEPPSTI